MGDADCDKRRATDNVVGQILSISWIALPSASQIPCNSKQQRAFVTQAEIVFNREIRSEESCRAIWQRVDQSMDCT